MSSKPETQPACPLCGHTDFVWGQLMGQGLQFQADEASLLQRTFGFGYQLRARLCGHCQNIQIFGRAADDEA